MKFISEYRNPKIIKKLISEIKITTIQNWNIMEVCGGQTHSLLKYGLDEIFQPKINYLHGPGCPVCVTPTELIDKVIYLSKQQNLIITSFGDMLRVPGSNTDLLHQKSIGADVRVVYSPMDSLEIAESNSDKEIVFFAVGFETTAPLIATTVDFAYKKNIKNFSIVCANVLVPPSVEFVLSDKENNIDGLLAPGHVCTITGLNDYIKISEKHKIPIVITGFEPYDLLRGTLDCIKLLEKNKFEVINKYARSVTRDGNKKAVEIMNSVFKIVDRNWRGIGNIPNSGLELNEKYAPYNAEYKFNIPNFSEQVEEKCMSGLILRGLKKPNDCPYFGKECAPENPFGATMVSSEGACAAYFNNKLKNIK